VGPQGSTFRRLRALRRFPDSLLRARAEHG
jgi:hypothetical protein